MSPTTMTKTEQENAADVRAKVMSNGKRRAILMAYRDKGPIAPVEITHAIGLSISDVSYHTRELRKHGFIELVKTEPVRGSTKSWYVATERHLIEAPEWKNFDPLQKQVALGETFAPLVDDFNRAVGAGTFRDDGQFHIWRTPLKSVDREGLAEILDLHRKMSEAVDDAAARAADRMTGSGEEAISVTSASQCFEVPGF